MIENMPVKADKIQNLIHTARGVQVMLDMDLAELYGVETRVLNQAVKRNSGRFPEAFCFQLSDDELEILKSQFVMSSWGGRRSNPYAFTEQGVAMLSAVLKSDTAVRVSVQIMNAFVSMRRFFLSNAQVFQRIDTLEKKQLVTENKIDKVLNAIESNEIKPKQGIFYDGQIFDAYRFVSDLFRSAKKSIVIIDGNTVYHFGASLKDLGKKWFAFSKMDIGAAEMLGKLEAML